MARARAYRTGLGVVAALEDRLAVLVVAAQREAEATEVDHLCPRSSAVAAMRA